MGAITRKRTMIIQFTVGNWKSFKDKVTISMVAAKIKAKDPQVDEGILIPVAKGFNLLTSAAVYGANASGKSNLISAIEFMRSFIIDSSRESQTGKPIEVEKFKLSTETINEPTYFEMIFILENRRHRYGFIVTREKVVEEWLYLVPTIKEAKLFTRKLDVFEMGSKFSESKDLVEKTRSNALFVSVLAQFNSEIATNIVDWFRNLRVMVGSSSTFPDYTKVFLKQELLIDRVIKLVKELDTGINGITVEDTQDEAPSWVPKDKLGVWRDINSTIKTLHPVFDAKGIQVSEQVFDMNQEESDGTRKIILMSGYLILALETGGVLIIDEMEARLHPLITKAIIRMFNSKETNPNRAQLILTTHDTNMLDKNLFRRDQIWFTEKDDHGASHLYSLVEFKPRNDASLESNYLQGRYGAIPFLGNLDIMCQDDKE